MRGIPHFARTWGGEAAGGPGAGGVGDIVLAVDNPQPGSFLACEGQAVDLATHPKLGNVLQTRFLADVTERSGPWGTSLTQLMVKPTGRAPGELIAYAHGPYAANADVPLYLSTDNGQTWTQKNGLTSAWLLPQFTGAVSYTVVGLDVIWDPVNEAYLLNMHTTWSSGGGSGAGGRKSFSTDLTNWSPLTSGSLGSIGSITAHIMSALAPDGTIVIVSGSRSVVTLAPNANRTATTAGSTTSNGMRLTWGGDGKFVAFKGQSPLWTSDDGVTWTAREVPITHNAIQYGPLGWVVFQGPNYYLTDDFITFSSAQPLSGLAGNQRYTQLWSDDGYPFYAVFSWDGSEHFINISTDLVTWEATPWPSDDPTNSNFGPASLYLHNGLGWGSRAETSSAVRAASMVAYEGVRLPNYPQVDGKTPYMRVK